MLNPYLQAVLRFRGVSQNTVTTLAQAQGGVAGTVSVQDLFVILGETQMRHLHPLRPVTIDGHWCDAGAQLSQALYEFFASAAAFADRVREQGHKYAQLPERIVEMGEPKAPHTVRALELHEIEADIQGPVGLMFVTALSQGMALVSLTREGVPVGYGLVPASTLVDGIIDGE